LNPKNKPRIRKKRLRSCRRQKGGKATGNEWGGAERRTKKEAGVEREVANTDRGTNPGGK